MDRSGARGGGGGEEEEKATDIKSNNPHLAGGEKYRNTGNLKTTKMGCLSIISIIAIMVNVLYIRDDRNRGTHHYYRTKRKI